mmetsp:Transcript_42244/g.122093  ORF Transcript_42244/g.122093 Transcript_42244/m.122093 type:complete len:284 (+) Transcript_42244:1109-1960(+)
MAGAHVRDHGGAAIAAERVLEQPRHLRIAVRHKRNGGAERGDAIAQGEQGPIDVGALDHAHPLVVRLRRSLGACEIDHRELAQVDLRDDARRLVPLLHDDLQHRVAAAAGDISAGRLCGAVFIPLVQQGHDLLSALQPADLADSGDAHALHRVLPNVQVVCVGPEQVAHLLVVDFEEGALHFEVALFALRGDLAEQIQQSQHHDAGLRLIPEHRVRLTCAGRTVREDRGVETLENTVDQAADRALEHLLRRRKLAEGVLENIAPLLRLVDSQVVVCGRRLRVL